jgi:hypothetical protein
MGSAETVEGRCGADDVGGVEWREWGKVGLNSR